MNCTFSIIGGDYNVVQNSSLDRNSDTIYNKRAYNVINKFKEEQDFEDVWRNCNQMLNGSHGCAANPTMNGHESIIF